MPVRVGGAKGLERHPPRLALVHRGCAGRVRSGQGRLVRIVTPGIRWLAGELLAAELLPRSQVPTAGGVQHEADAVGASQEEIETQYPCQCGEQAPPALFDAEC